MQKLLLILAVFWIIDLRAQEYKGDAEWVGEQLFRDVNNPSPDCEFVKLYGGHLFLESVKLAEVQLHVIDHAFISGCNMYQIIWNAPSKITGITKSNNKTVYLSTLSDGLYVYKNERVQKLYVSNVNFPNEIFDLKSIGQELLFSSIEGISSFNLNNHILTTLYPKEQLEVQMTLDTFSRLWIKEGETLWLDDSRFDPLSIELGLNEISGQDIGSSVVLGKQNSFEAKVVSNLIGVERPSKYAYKLNNSNWVIQNDPFISIKQFPKERNELLVKVISGEYESPSLLTKIEIKSEIEDSFWKYMFYGLGLLLGIVMIGFFRERNLRNSVNQKIFEIRSNRKLATTQRKVLQLEMNPHFLYNSLSSIKGLIAGGKNKEARAYLSRFANMMRSVLEGSKEDQITIEKEVKFLEDYMALESMCRNDLFDFEIKIDDAVERQTMMPAMMIQPFVENSIIHGFKQLVSRRPFIKILIQSSDIGTKYTIEDNGVGRTNQDDSNTTHTSYASRIVADRLKSMNRDEFEIEDLKDKSGNAIGTRVSFKI